jgi:hypothetical protein
VKEYKIDLSEATVARLQKEADEAGLVLEDYIARIIVEMLPPPPNTTEAHLYAAKRAKIVGSDPTISARSREIIEEEMEKNLFRQPEDDKPAE